MNPDGLPNAVGLGVSSPAENGGRAFTLGHVEGEVQRGTDTLFALNAGTGENLWRHGTWGQAWMGRVVHGNLVFVANAALPRGCGLIRFEGGKPRVLWEVQQP